MRKTIALCMIVKNEEKGLVRAVKSCLPFVDNVYIAVDTASNDKTITLAKGITKHVKMFEWKDDFSYARNLVAEDVREDYILFIDGHEYVQNYDNLDKVLETDFKCFFVRIQMESGAIFQAPRIYKRGIKFYGAVHETLQLDAPVRYDNFLIIHDRENGQDPASAKIREQQRDEQMPRIMGERLKKNPADLRASFHLMNFALSKADYSLALKYSKLYLKYSKDKEQRWYVYYSRSLCFCSLGSLWRAYWAITRASWEIPNRWENLKMLGIIFFERGNYEKSLKYLVDSFTPNSKKYMYEPLVHDDAGTWNLMGEAFYRLGIYDKASTAFQRASEHAKVAIQKEFFGQRADLMARMATGRIDYK